MNATMPRPRRKERPADDEHVTFSIRLPGHVYNAVSDLSDHERRTLSAQIVLMIERQLEAAQRTENG